MLDVKWCSICLAKQAEGTATVKDGFDLIELPMCKDCVRKLTPPGERYSLGIE